MQWIEIWSFFLLSVWKFQISHTHKWHTPLSIVETFICQPFVFIDRIFSLTMYYYYNLQKWFLLSKKMVDLLISAFIQSSFQFGNWLHQFLRFCLLVFFVDPFKKWICSNKFRFLDRICTNRHFQQKRRNLTKRAVAAYSLRANPSDWSQEDMFCAHWVSWGGRIILSKVESTIYTKITDEKI